VLLGTAFRNSTADNKRTINKVKKKHGRMNLATVVSSARGTDTSITVPSRGLLKYKRIVTGEGLMATHHT